MANTTNKFNVFKTNIIGKRNPSFDGYDEFGITKKGTSYKSDGIFNTG